MYKDYFNEIMAEIKGRQDVVINNNIEFIWKSILEHYFNCQTYLTDMDGKPELEFFREIIGLFEDYIWEEDELQFSKFHYYYYFYLFLVNELQELYNYDRFVGGIRHARETYGATA